MKVALVCDWLTNVGGAEKVLLEIHELFPEAPIYTSKYDSKGIDWFEGVDVRTGWLQIFPSKLRRILGPLRQRYFSRLDLSEYDLIISVTGAEAKSVKSGRKLKKEGKKSSNPKGVHISFCHVPTQYYWQMYDDYVKNPGFGVLNPVVRVFFKLMVKPLRRADYKAAQNPDYYITISEYAKTQIKKYYKREAVIVHPPVEIDDFKIKQGNKVKKSQGRKDGESDNKNSRSQAKKGTNLKNKIAERQEEKSTLPVENFDISDAYIVTSRQVNWKRIDLAVLACKESGRNLIVIGEGPEHEKLVKLADSAEGIVFLPLMKKAELARYLGQAKGYLFPSLEPFGIAPVEALAAGCPVIAYGEGGALDYVIDGENGVLFPEQSTTALIDAMDKFEKMEFNRQEVAETVSDYGQQRFDREIRQFIDEKV